MIWFSPQLITSPATMTGFLDGPPIKVMPVVLPSQLQDGEEMPKIRALDCMPGSDVFMVGTKGCDIFEARQLTFSLLRRPLQCHMPFPIQSCACNDGSPEGGHILMPCAVPPPLSCRWMRIRRC